MNTPGGNTNAAAELTITLLMSLAREILTPALDIKNGKWTKKESTEVMGKTLGLIGIGKIGTEVARKAHGLGMNIIAFDPLTM